MTNVEKLAELLAQLAYREGDFQLSSGRKSDFYLDAKQVTYHPDGVQCVGRAVLDLIETHNIEAVGGLTMGADAIVTSVVWASIERARPIPGFVVRKEPKAHGLNKGLEGIAPKGKRVAIVDDVITTGDSVIKAVKVAQDMGAEVALVVALVDREEGGRENIEQLGVPFLSVCTVSEIRQITRQGAGAAA